MSDTSIGVITTVYKRPQNLAEQLTAIRGQTVAPASIALWQNGNAAIDPGLLTGVLHVKASANMGVWPRFLLGLELNTRYVCVFDDDTIPGSRWFENCLTTMKTHRGVLGTVGVIFKNSMNRQVGWRRVGWCYPNEKTAEADIVGHSWFFERDWLRYYALEPRHGTKFCGEDYHLSVCVQKHLKLKTWVPPHPIANKALWGSLKGKELGGDQVALFRAAASNTGKIAAHAAYAAAGWKLVEAGSK